MSVTIKCSQDASVYVDMIAEAKGMSKEDAASYMLKVAHGRIGALLTYGATAKTRNKSTRKAARPASIGKNGKAKK